MTACRNGNLLESLECAEQLIFIYGQPRTDATPCFTQCRQCRSCLQRIDLGIEPLDRTLWEAVYRNQFVGLNNTLPQYGEEDDSDEDDDDRRRRRSESLKNHQNILCMYSYMYIYFTGAVRSSSNLISRQDNSHDVTLSRHKRQAPLRPDGDACCNT